MVNCDGTFRPKPTAPPNWILTPENLYNGKLLDIFAGVYAAAELAKQTTPGEANDQWTTRKNQWIDFLNRLKNPPNQNTKIIDLGLVPDLCANGRPVDPGIPALTPEALANGSVGNAVAELYKQQLFDQWCECKPRDRPAETCPCQRYIIETSSRRRGPSPVGPILGTFYKLGRLGALEQRPDPNGTNTQFGFMTGIGCSENGQSRESFFSFIAPSNSELGDWEVRIVSVRKDPSYPVIDCNSVPPPPEPPPYLPGLPPGFDINLPPELPRTPPATWDAPGWFIPVRSPFGVPTFPVECPPPMDPEYMFWDIKNEASSIFYSDTPPPSGVVVFGTSDTVDFDVTFAIANALADKTLRSWRKRTEPLDIDTTFINVANIYLMIDGVAIGDGEEMNVPRMRIRVPFEYRNRQKAVKIMPKGINTPIVVADSGNRWIPKKFPTT